MLTDSHCHLDRLGDIPVEQALEFARQRGVERFLCVAIDAENTPVVAQLASQYEGVFASAGLHPMSVGEDAVASEHWLREWGRREDIIALGETGLDYHYSPDTAELQQQSFASHLRVAGELGKPVIVHTREARQDTLALIKEYGCSESAGVLHCFTESWEMARAALDMNYYISISGIVTFPRASELREVVRRLPLDRILVETDSPYLAPVPYRGKTNQPGYVSEVAECCADLLGIEVAALAAQTSANFDRLFGLGSLAAAGES